MNYWEFKGAGFKVAGSVAYEGYFLNKFHGYYCKVRKYQLVQYKNVQGKTQQKEKFAGFGWELLHKDKMETWEQFKTYHSNFVNEITA